MSDITATIDRFGEVATAEAANNTAEALEANGFKVEVVDTLEDAKKTVLELIPEGSQVFTNTSATTQQAGISEALDASGKYVSVRAESAKLDMQTQGRDYTKLTATPDYMVGSVHALTEDGHALIASGTGSQLVGYVGGAANVIWVVGAQKIVADIPEGMDRIFQHTLPLESERINKLYNMTAGSNVNNLLIKYADTQDRITVVIVREAAGF